MDRTEIIALLIVAAAAILALRYFFGKKGGDCWSKNCFKPKGPFEKK